MNDTGIIARKSAAWDEAITFYEEATKQYKSINDERGMAQTYNNLGSVYARKGEWDRAIAMYEQSLETMERVGDIHGMAQTYGNLGNFHQAQGDSERAAWYMARAYVIFAQLGAAPGAQQAGRLLIDILGSEEAAEAYLAQFVQEDDHGYDNE